FSGWIGSGWLRGGLAVLRFYKRGGEVRFPAGTLSLSLSDVEGLLVGTRKRAGQEHSCQQVTHEKADDREINNQGLGESSIGLGRPHLQLQVFGKKTHVLRNVLQLN